MRSELIRKMEADVSVEAVPSEERNQSLLPFALLTLLSALLMAYLLT